MQSVGQGDGDSVPLVHVVTPCNPSWNRSYRSPYNHQHGYPAFGRSTSQPRHQPAWQNGSINRGGMVGGSDGARAGPRFSVVVPAYNESAFLGECLQSLASQDFSGTYEVIVIDNLSLI